MATYDGAWEPVDANKACLEIFGAFIIQQKGYPLFPYFGERLTTVDKVIKVYDGDIKAYDEKGACFKFVTRDRPEV